MVKVLFDHNMPPSIAHALNPLISIDGHEAYALRDKFSANISDIDYFTALGKESGWIVISKDLANAKRGPERQAILSSGVLAFYLAKTVQRQSITEQAATILWQWDRLVQQRANNANGLFQLPVGKGSKFTAL
ncbi:PIN-like domain-containing protein [Yoonia sp. 2307UL14-13]|uniref:PIN-like domain-containing protein n=1 Tax=Yoonia sp. 2307UL14-13 TaxID=3126506 RepID=UPI0030A8CFBE